MAAGVLAQHQRGLFQADHFGPHDLVGRGVLQHAVLVDAALVRERIPADDGLVVLHRERCRRRHHLRGAGQLRSVDLVPVGEFVVTHVDRHHDLFERSVAGALADAVDRALDLTRTADHAGQRIRHGHAEVVMAMHREHGLVRVRHALDQRLDEVGVFLRHRVAHGVRNVHRGRAGLDDGLDDAAQILHLAAGAVFGRPFDVVDLVAGARDHRDRCFEHFLRRLVQLHPHMQRRGRDHGVGRGRVLQISRLRRSDRCRPDGRGTGRR